jgi:hypothetical protein
VLSRGLHLVACSVTLSLTTSVAVKRPQWQVASQRHFFAWRFDAVCWRLHQVCLEPVVELKRHLEPSRFVFTLAHLCRSKERRADPAAVHERARQS